MSLHDGVCSPFNPVGAPSVIITTERYEGVLPLRLRACWIFIVLIPRRFLFIILLQIMLNVSSTLLLRGSREQYAEKPCYYTYCTHPHAQICSHFSKRREREWERQRGTDRLLEWSAASPCFQPLWSGWRYPSGTYWWWSSCLQPGSGLRLLVSHSGQLGFPRWCDLFYEALPHMRFQLLANSDWACMSFNEDDYFSFFLVGMEKG